MVRVKICGVTTREDAVLACEWGADAIGLNFFPESPRCVSPFEAERIVRELPPFVAAVGVFVNWKREAVVALAKAMRLTAVQLHGEESPEETSEIAQEIKVIKALRPGPGTKLASLDAYGDASALLLDAAKPGAYGGTGTTGDWEFARNAARAHRVILAGGLTPENVEEAIGAVRPYAVDVASGVEVKPGKKDKAKMEAFFAGVARAHAPSG